jgi:CheY-like chemotaxis protein
MGERGCAQIAPYVERVLRGETVQFETELSYAFVGPRFMRSQYMPEFEPFTQIRDPKRPQGGLGIGLTLVRRLVELHGGDIQGHSDGPGKGSKFIVRLPVLAAAEGSQQRPRNPYQSPLRPVKARILVVDDLKDSAASFAVLLRLMGNEVRVAYDGLEAVEAAAEFQPNLVFLDIGLPNLDGYEACRRIRALPCAGESVMVAVTDMGRDDDRRKAIEAGFDHHMIKPGDLRQSRNCLGRFRPEARQGGCFPPY